MSEPTLRLLIPSAGRKVALMRSLERYFKVYPAGVELQGSAACCLAGRGRYVTLPEIDADNFEPELLSAIRRIGIDVVLPVRNDDILKLVSLREKISEAGSGARLVTSSPPTLAYCFDKLALFHKLIKHHFHTPYTALSADWKTLPEDPWPLFVKDRFGSGSSLAQKVRTPEELGAIMVHCEPDKLIVQPFLRGQEYTLDMFFDWRGRVRQQVLRKRISALNGQMDSGEVVAPLDCDSYRKVANLGSFMDFVGPINVQFIRVEDSCYITDVNPRFSGGIGLTIASGADFPAYLLDMVGDREILIKPSRVGTRAASYTDYVYG